MATTLKEKNQAGTLVEISIHMELDSLLNGRAGIQRPPLCCCANTTSNTTEGIPVGVDSKSSPGAISPPNSLFLPFPSEEVFNPFFSTDSRLPYPGGETTFSKAVLNCGC